MNPCKALASAVFVPFLVVAAGHAPAQSLCYLPSLTSTQNWQNLTFEWNFTPNQTVRLYQMSTAHNWSGQTTRDAFVVYQGIEIPIGQVQIAQSAAFGYLTWDIQDVHIGVPFTLLLRYVSGQTTVREVHFSTTQSNPELSVVRPRGITGCADYDLAVADRGLTLSAADDAGLQPPGVTVTASSATAGMYAASQPTTFVIAPGEVLTMSAPAQSGNYVHTGWRINGTFTALPNIIELPVCVDLDLVAVYDRARVMTVDATEGGAPIAPTIEVSPADINGQTAAAAPAEFPMASGQQVTLTAPDVFGGRSLFRRWRVDGLAQPLFYRETTVTSDDEHTLRAEYEETTCFAADIGPALGMGDDTLSIGHALGFDFPLPGGGITDTIDISSNGFVWLVSGASTDPSPAIGTASMQNDPPRIAALWQDLEYPTAASDVHFLALSDRAVVTWRRAAFGASSALFSVQCTLFESGRVQIAHSGDPSAMPTAVTGVFPGNGMPLPEFGDPSTSWQTSGNAGWWWIFSPAELQPRVYTSAPNADGGFDGYSMTTFCAPATVQDYGHGCPTGSSFFELGDGESLANRSFRLQPNQVGGYDVSECTTNCYEAAIGSATGIGDDELQTVGLPFTFPYPSNTGGTNAISVCSNGYVWLAAGSTTSAGYSIVPSNLFAEPARLAPFWTDLNPADSLSDDLYVNVLTDRVVITWHEVVEAGRFLPHTAQCVLHDDGVVTLSFGATTQVFDEVLTGFSPGNGAASVGSMPLVANLPFSTSGEGLDALHIDTAWTPVLGESLLMTVSGLPIAPTVGLMLVGFAPTSLDLSFLGAPGCQLLNTADVLSAALLVASPAALELGVPSSPQLLGETLFAQAAALAPGINPLGFVTSNGLGLTLGEF